MEALCSTPSGVTDLVTRTGCEHRQRRDVVLNTSRRHRLGYPELGAEFDAAVRVQRLAASQTWSLDVPHLEDRPVGEQPLVRRIGIGLEIARIARQNPHGPFGGPIRCLILARCVGNGAVWTTTVPHPRSAEMAITRIFKASGQWRISPGRAMKRAYPVGAGDDTLVMTPSSLVSRSSSLRPRVMMISRPRASTPDDSES
jgi:hypothetical protein